MKAIVSEELSERLVDLQNAVAREEVPLLIIFEGTSSRVVSHVINEVARALEPRFVTYHGLDMLAPGKVNMMHLLTNTPAKGETVLMDRSWYTLAVLNNDGSKIQLKETVERINGFEEYLTDNGTRIIKILLSASPVAMSEHQEDYGVWTSLTDSYLVSTPVDRVKFNTVMGKLVPQTDTERAPWDVIDVSGLESTVERTVKAIAARFEETLSSDAWRKPHRHKLQQIYPNPRKDLDMSQEVEKYKKRMAELSNELERLQILLSLSPYSLVLAFEGWDAAGKGGCIKHITHAMNPRGYTIDRVKKPDSREYAHTYLWRFADYLPAKGRVAIFDRSWYGRMLVEPIEGFCTKEEYHRSADEINRFEEIITHSGQIVLKFWLEITPEEQAKRFEDRKTNPQKSWKFTEEDERNASRRDVYPEYIDRMIACTNTSYAPWIAVPSENKKVAHIIVMETIVNALKEKLHF